MEGLIITNTPEERLEVRPERGNLHLLWTVNEDFPPPDWPHTNRIILNPEEIEKLVNYIKLYIEQLYT